ncbi:MAG: succinate dehydrogenase assembly factor 2 [Alphaproteobacteria bacterium]|nr:succinate dehydrogenase assembly factor 2 [Alphaproteobacteria bacterium]
MTDAQSDIGRRRKRLKFRSWHRGMREVDLLIGRFADRNLDLFSERQLDLFEALLHETDPDLYGWVTGRQPIPNDLDHDVMRLLKTFTLSAGRD